MARVCPMAFYKLENAAACPLGLLSDEHIFRDFDSKSACYKKGGGKMAVAPNRVFRVERVTGILTTNLPLFLAAVQSKSAIKRS